MVGTVLRRDNEPSPVVVIFLGLTIDILIVLHNYFRPHNNIIKCICVPAQFGKKNPDQSDELGQSIARMCHSNRRLSTTSFNNICNIKHN